MAKAKLATQAGLFTPADYQTLRLARQTLNNLIPQMDKAKACGVDCSSYLQMVQDLDQQLAAIQQHFMTPPPA